MAGDCIFCKIRDGEIPGDILYRDDDCFVIRDIAPKASTHLLVIPNQHFLEVSDMTSDFAPVAGNMIRVAGAMAKQEGVSESGYRLIINQGRNSGQIVPHLHLHVLGGRPLGNLG
jgi:histidine triad (HIT) family protein